MTDINFINTCVESIWNKIGIDKPSNHDEVIQFCHNDVCETADPENWHSGDVDIAFRRWIESKAGEPAPPPAEETPEQIMTSLGFKKDAEYDYWKHPDLKFEIALSKDRDTILLLANLEYRIKELPFSRQNVENILKAFNPE